MNHSIRMISEPLDRFEDDKPGSSTKASRDISDLTVQNTDFSSHPTATHNPFDGSGPIKVEEGFMSPKKGEAAIEDLRIADGVATPKPMVQESTTPEDSNTPKVAPVRIDSENTPDASSKFADPFVDDVVFVGTPTEKELTLAKSLANLKTVKREITSFKVVEEATQPGIQDSKSFPVEKAELH